MFVILLKLLLLVCEFVSSISDLGINLPPNITSSEREEVKQLYLKIRTNATFGSNTAQLNPYPLKNFNAKWRYSAASDIVAPTGSKPAIKKMRSQRISSSVKQQLISVLLVLSVFVPAKMSYSRLLLGSVHMYGPKMALSLPAHPPIHTPLTKRVIMLWK